MTVKTRFAPSPTGYLHVGGARTALFSWLYARHCGGTFVLRIEDTDLERSTKEAKDAILESMKWLGLEWDEGPFYQTERMGRYNEVIEQMLSEGKAYKCYCSKERLEELRERQMKEGKKPRYDGHCREDSHEHGPDESYVVRFKNPQEGKVEFDDINKGHMVFDNRELDDFIIRRSDGSPTYNFCVVVDDMDMGITHVIRGDDHLNNTPRQINLYRALGFEVPSFCHVAMILGPDGAKLSKRHGAVSVMQYRDDGYLPDAMVNYLARLGWSHGDQEIFSRDELVSLFSLEGISKSPSSFSPKKLNWLNAHYIRGTDPQIITRELAWHLDRLGVNTSGGPDLLLVVQNYAQRVQTLLEMAEKARIYYEDFDGYDEAGVKKWIKEGSVEVLRRALDILKGLEGFDASTIDARLEGLAGELGIGMGQIGQPLRIAITGGPSSPGIGDTMVLVGRERTLERIGRAIEHFGKGS